MSRRALVTGWFSFEGMGATSGDLIARDLARDWLADAGIGVDVANAAPFTGGVEWEQADPARYTHVVFVCGPAGNGWPLTELLERFRSCRLVGLNLSMLEALETWNPFSVLIERDSSRAANPDITFASVTPPVPVVGLVLVHAQTEYPDPRHAQAEAAVERLVVSRDVAPVRIDTRLDVPDNPLRSPAAVESMIRRTDAVVTTRLHGLVTALKLGIPAVAIDPISGGAKVARQAQAVGWPTVFTVDDLDDRALADALDFCLSSDGRALAAACAERARERVAGLRADFVRAVLEGERGQPMATIVLGSYAVQFPVGGYFSWVLQWMVGLRDLGHDPWFVERAHSPGSCFDPSTNAMSDDCSFGTASLHALLERYSLGDRWCFVDAHGEYHGRDRSTVDDVLDDAALFVDMGTKGTWDDATRAARQRVYVDGEPAFTQFKLALRLRRAEPVERYDAYFTVGQNIGQPWCPVPTSGIAWRPILYPVVTSLFPVVAPPADAPFTTVMSWSAHDRVEFDGETYGAKDLEFPKFIDLPRRVRVPVEIAVNAHAPRPLLADHGWRVRDALEVSSTFDQFCDYIRSSRGEFSVCKNGFVATRSGWVGDRIGAYLACGRPVVMQDTGFGERLPCGEGLFAVRDLDEAVDAIERIEADPERHRSAARAIAETHFEAEAVLGAMLAELGVGSPGRGRGA